jgi:hypothetical protein
VLGGHLPMVVWVEAARRSGPVGARGPAVRSVWVLRRGRRVRRAICLVSGSVRADSAELHTRGSGWTAGPVPLQRVMQRVALDGVSHRRLPAARTSWKSSASERPLSAAASAPSIVAC